MFLLPANTEETEITELNIGMMLWLLMHTMLTVSSFIWELYFLWVV